MYQKFVKECLISMEIGSRMGSRTHAVSFALNFLMVPNKTSQGHFGQAILRRHFNDVCSKNRFVMIFVVVICYVFFASLWGGPGTNLR
jgi:hypothetical protein